MKQDNRSKAMLTSLTHLYIVICDYIEVKLFFIYGLYIYSFLCEITKYFLHCGHLLIAWLHLCTYFRSISFPCSTRSGTAWSAFVCSGKITPDQPANRGRSWEPLRCALSLKRLRCSTLQSSGKHEIIHIRYTLLCLLSGLQKPKSTYFCSTKKFTQ